MCARGAIALFVKTPGLSPVKTRLAKELGVDAAEVFHRSAAWAVSAVIYSATQQTALDGYYAVAEQTALTHGLWQAMPTLWQGEGGLGERMSTVYQELLKQYDFVLLVGADVPQMTADQLLNAASWFIHDGQARFVFGPSLDGGFWLFGGNHSLPLSVWTDVTYSVADTGTQFLGKIEPLGQVQLIASLRDVDEPADLAALYEALQHLESPVNEQISLMNFLESLLHCQSININSV